MLNDLHSKANSSAVVPTNKPGKIESPGRGGSNTYSGANGISTSADPQQITTKPSNEENSALIGGGTEQ